jgi:hypothetical protein
MNKINIELDDLLLPYTFDLSIYSHIKNCNLRDHINRVGKIFIRKSKTGLYLNNTPKQ